MSEPTKPLPVNSTLDEPGFVYVISPFPHGDRVKIGWSKTPRQRLATLQVGSPQKLRILVTAPATRREEKALHGRLSIARQHGEWFALSEGIKSVIREIRRGEPPQKWGLMADRLDRPALLTRQHAYSEALAGLRAKGLL